MPEIPHSAFTAHLKEHRPSDADPVYLIFGEAFLCRQAAADLVQWLIPDPSARIHSHEVLNHAEDGQVGDLIERLNTYSFFAEKKIIELREATLFANRQNAGDLLANIRQAFDADQHEKAAIRFLNLLARLRTDLQDLAPLSDENLAETLGLEDPARDPGWIRKIMNYCLERKLAVPDAADDAERLGNALERGFPKNNILLITADAVDKRKNLYKTIAARGTVVDCSIPKGNRKADQDAQRVFLQAQVRHILSVHHKKMDSRAFDLMFQMTGFDMGAFTANLDKLVDYARERDVITADDVRAVLIRTRQDPIYELTGAIAEKNAVKSLYFLNSLLEAGFHPLQMVSAMANQARKLLVIRGFLDSEAGRGFHAGMGFDQFRTQMLPAIRSDDAALLDQVRLYDAAAGTEAGEGKKSGKKAVVSDLVIAANPANSYPIYQQFLRALNFSRPALFSAMRLLSQADVKLKTSAASPAFVLEDVIFKICGAEPGARRNGHDRTRPH